MINERAINNHAAAADHVIKHYMLQALTASGITPNGDTHAELEGLISAVASPILEQFEALELQLLELQEDVKRLKDEARYHGIDI